MQDGCFRKSLAHVATGKFGIAGHKRDARIRPDCFQSRREITTTHFRHDHIAQKEVDRPWMTAGNFQRRQPPLGFQDVVALHAQELASQLAHPRFVLDD